MRRFPVGASSLSSGIELAVLVKQLFRLLVPHPLLEDPQLFGVLLNLGQGHLVGAPKTLEPVTTDFLRRAPSFRRAQHDHRPARPLSDAGLPAFLLVLSDFVDAMFNRGRHGLVHAFRVGSFDEVRRPSVARAGGPPVLRA